MIVIAGKWDTGWFAPLKEFKLWEAVLRPFGLDKLIMSPISGIKQTNIILEEYKSLDDIFNQYSTFKKVFVECPQNVDSYSELKDYVHPTGDVMYIFGNSAAGNSNYITKDDDVVGITTPIDLTIMWAFNIIPIVLYDRENKL